MKSKPLITIFTPTYNRAYILPKLYKSLQEQECQDFEWIVVDDGSTDATEELIHKWKKERNAFPITYEKVKNGGKHRAINRGVKLANSPLFFIIDSDDQLAPGAIQNILEMSRLTTKRAGLAGFSGIRITPSGKTVGGDGNLEGWDYIDASNLEREHYNLLGDKAEVYFTEILKKYPFPEFKGENFLDEGIVWNKIAQDGYKIRWFNKPLCICEYRDDGLTKNLNQKNFNNPKGFALYTKEKAKHTNSPIKKLRAYYSYFTIMKATQSKRSIMKSLQIGPITYSLLVLISKVKK